MKLVCFLPFFCLLLTLSSCEKKEPLWELVPLGEGKVDSVAQGEEYTRVIFYRFSDGLKTERDINTWSLAFESAPEGWHIRLNNGRGTSVSTTGSQDFSTTYSVGTSTRWRYDISSGHEDSTAIGQWLNLPNKDSKQDVILLNLGFDVPIAERYRKMQILSVTDTNYTIRYAKLDDSNEQQVSIAKSNVCTYTYFDFLLNSTVAYAPAPSEYDIQFTKYYTILMDGTTPIDYSVNGVLLNPVNTVSMKLDPTAISFDSLSIEKLNGQSFASEQDAIGHEWKYYDLNGTGRYVVRPNLYVVKDVNGVVWKLSFVGFYNSAGVKGYPQFRYQRIQ